MANQQEERNPPDLQTECLAGGQPCLLRTFRRKIKAVLRLQARQGRSRAGPLTCSSSRLNSQYSRRVPLPLVRIPQPLIMMVPRGKHSLVRRRVSFTSVPRAPSPHRQRWYLTADWSWWLGIPNC